VKGNYEYVSGVPHSSKNTIGAQRAFTKNDIENDPMEAALSMWVAMFSERMNCLSLSPRYFELRPYSYA